MSAPITLDSPEEAMALTIASPLVHFTTFAAIENKDGKLIRNPVPSKLQREIFQAYEWLVANNQPVRIIAAPNSRQAHKSTSVCHLCYHHARRFHSHGLIMADEGDRTKKIWAMFQRFAQHDDFKPYWDSRYEGNTEECRFHFRDADGSKRVATWEHETASDAAAGAAGTRQVLWFSECMRYRREGVAADTLVIGNAINSVPFKPGTAIFLESTAEGPGGFAYGIHREAVTLAERMAGNFGNGWVKIFSGWHECEDYQLDPVRPESVGWFDDADVRFERFRGREEAGRTLYGWTAPQIAWRRQKIVADLKGNEGLFDRDFPESEDVAFASSIDRRFDHVGVARMLKLAERDHGRAQRGTLQENAGKVRFQLDAQNGFVWMIEPPLVGRSYCLFGDFMEGEQATGEESTLDAHAVGILRESYRDTEGVEWPDEVVATIDVPNGCRWDIDVIAKRMRLLSMHYANCIVVPECNNPGAVAIKQLHEAGVSIYQRKHPDHLDPNKTVKARGFRTTSRTKDHWVEAMAEALRDEPGQAPPFICRYLPAVHEFATFVRNADGSCSAMTGKHDDWVAAIAIALYVRAFTRIEPGVSEIGSNDGYTIAQPAAVRRHGSGACG